MDLLQVVVLSVIEGLTEFLPVSSTGHLILAQGLLKVPASDFSTSFNIAIQLGAILAVVATYPKRLFADRPTMLRLLIAFAPTAAAGFLLYPVVKHALLVNVGLVVYELFLGGVILVAFERFFRKGEEVQTSVSLGRAFWIGCFQALAMIPGVSRSAATIIGGLVLGVERRTIVEFSFLLAVPTMAAATGYDLLKSAGSFSSADLATLAAGFAVSFAVALAAIRWFLGYVQKHDFTLFGFYRIAAAALFWWFLK